MIPYITTGDTYTFFICKDGYTKTEVITKDDIRFESMLNCLKKNNSAEMLKLLEETIDKDYIKTKYVQDKIINYKNLKLVINPSDNKAVAYYKTIQLDDALTSLLYRLAMEGCDQFEHYIKFIDNIISNPSETAKKELYSFLTKCTLPITEEGEFIAYKGIRSDLFSLTGNPDTRVISGTVDSEGRILNTQGAVIEVVREDVDADCNVGCSYGLHVGTYSYARDFGSVVVAVLVNPKDVVSVPKDCSCHKCRVSKYKVLSIVDKEFDKASAVVNSDATVTTANSEPLTEKDLSCYIAFKNCSTRSYNELIEILSCDYIAEWAKKYITNKIVQTGTDAVPLRQLYKASSYLKTRKVTFIEFAHLMISLPDFKLFFKDKKSAKLLIALA